IIIIIISESKYNRDSAIVNTEERYEKNKFLCWTSRYDELQHFGIFTEYLNMQIGGKTFQDY
ncbi:hypothetical protein Anas_03502, partial [Armadillidium nasatum]